MVETLISVIIYLIIAGLIWWAVSTILGVLPVPEPIKTVINVLMIVVLCLIVVYALLPLIPRARLGYLGAPHVMAVASPLSHREVARLG